MGGLYTRRKVLDGCVYRLSYEIAAEALALYTRIPFLPHHVCKLLCFVELDQVVLYTRSPFLPHHVYKLLCLSGLIRPHCTREPLFCLITCTGCPILSVQKDYSCTREGCILRFTCTRRVSNRVNRRVILEAVKQRLKENLVKSLELRRSHGPGILERTLLSWVWLMLV